MKKKSKILVVDDDPKALILMEAMLKSHGYAPVLINDGRRALQTALKEKPDIILLDVMMPVSDGYTILKKIRKEETIKNTPVIMVTALDLDSHKVIASISGASAYVTKPINSRQLIETVARLLSDATSQ